MKQSRFKKLLQATASNIRECLFADKPNPSEWVKVSYTKRQQERGEFSVYVKDPKANRSGEEVVAQFKDYGGLVELRKRQGSSATIYVFRVKSGHLDEGDKKEPLKVVELEQPKEYRSKMSNADYIQAAEDFLSGKYSTKKAVADAYGVSSTIITDMFNSKYVRKSCAAKIEELKEKYSHQ